MSTEKHPLRHVGIYRNLPNFDPSLTGLTAIITGANGISGFNVMRALLDSPERWTRIYALSRRPPPDQMMKVLTEDQRSRVKHVSCDFLSDPVEIASALSSAAPELVDTGTIPGRCYAFFFSYVHFDWSDSSQLEKANATLIKNFLSALNAAGVRPKRVLLQTGAKHYGVHLGRVRTPMLESDPRPQLSDGEHNFYYPQQDALQAWCAEHDREDSRCGWNEVRPAWITGASTNAAMTAFYPLAIYAIVQQRRGLPLRFPGDWEQWQVEYHHSSARMTGYMAEWTVLEEHCRDQTFNVQDGGPFTWNRFLTELARWYGVTEGVVPPPDDESSMNLSVGRRGKDAPLGYGPSLTMRTSFEFSEWARDPANEQAWQDAVRDSGGDSVKVEPFQNPTLWAMADLLFVRNGSVSLNKARRFGWTGFVDTLEAIFEMYREMATMGMLLPMKVEAAIPLM